MIYMFLSVTGWDVDLEPWASGMPLLIKVDDLVLCVREKFLLDASMDHSQCLSL